ncbi:MAG: acyl-phosphate glycerol-3-phosphate acyltransferase [Clostridia bacterium]|nr:acyl-phosphate glycerol-3-phosphate acyltransferase [Clostridia bacterium]
MGVLDVLPFRQSAGRKVNNMNINIEILTVIILGYFLGSIPFALVVGKVFYHKDIRNYGSKNLGGGNAGRVLGKRAGLVVMTLDILKVTLVIFLTSFFFRVEMVSIIGGLAAAMGHCFPIFAKFKGGKAVAVMYGFLFGMVLFWEYSLWIFLLPLISFLIVLYLCKIIALASISSAVINSIFIGIFIKAPDLFWASLLFTAVIIVRHRKNIERILRKEENKITWMG